MQDSGSVPVTLLLRSWAEGDRSREDELFTAVHAQLLRIAEHQMRAERAGHTLDPAALVSEAYLRLRSANPDFVDRVHFFAIASRVMRRVLIDHARRRLADKRGGGLRVVTLQTDLQVAGSPSVDASRLETVLARLEQLDARKAEIFCLRHLAGLSNEEIATHAGLSPRTVRRELLFVRAFIRRELAS